MSFRLVPSSRTEVRRPLLTSDEGVAANGADAVAAYLQGADADGLTVPPGCPVAVIHALTPSQEQEVQLQAAVDYPSGPRVVAAMRAQQRRKAAALEDGREPDADEPLGDTDAANFSLYLAALAMGRASRGLVRIEGAEDVAGHPREYLDRLPLETVAEIGMLVRQAGEVPALGKALSVSQPSEPTPTRPD